MFFDFAIVISIDKQSLRACFLHKTFSTFHASARSFFILYSASATYVFQKSKFPPTALHNFARRSCRTRRPFVIRRRFRAGSRYGLLSSACVYASNIDGLAVCGACTFRFVRRTTNDRSRRRARFSRRRFITLSEKRTRRNGKTTEACAWGPGQGLPKIF